MKVKRVIPVFLSVVIIAAFAACNNSLSSNSGTLSYDANGGYGTLPAAQTADLSSKVTVASQNGLSKSGYIFYGWNTKAAGNGDNYAVGATLTLTGDITLYAKWFYVGIRYPGNEGGGGGLAVTRNTPLSVSYDANGGSGTPPSDPGTYAYGDYVKVRSANPPLENEGYVFAEWVTHTEYIENGISLTSGSTFIIHEDLVQSKGAVKRATLSNDQPHIETELILFALWLDESNVINLMAGNDNISSKKFTFPEKEFGYTANDLRSQEMTILNITDEATTDLDVTVSGEKFDGAFPFDIVGLGTTVAAIGARGHESFTIVPKTGLPVGNYSIKIEIAGKTASGKEVYSVFIVGFVVKPVPLTLTAGALNYRDAPGEYEGIDSITPLFADGYTERTATLEVRVTGFKDASHAAGLAFWDVNGLSFKPDAGTFSGRTMTYRVTVNYETGDEPFNEISNNIVLELKSSHEGYSQYAYTIVPIKVTDGQDTSRAVPLNGINILPFNAYASDAYSGGLERHYKQTENITLASPNAGESNWTAIGDGYGNAFTGSYNGGGFTIGNLTIVKSESYQGLFGYIGEGAVIEKLGLVGVTIDADSYETVGGLVGDNNGTVQNCYVKGYPNGGFSSIKGYSNIGGLTGNTGDGGTLQNCYAENTNVTSGSSTGNNANNTGGISGRNSGIVQNCYSTGGTVTGYYHAGGVVGKLRREGSRVEYCYSTCDVYNSSNITSPARLAGGVVGDADRGGLGQNLVALNRIVEIKVSTGRVGRVGYSSLDSGAYGEYYNVYARSGMKLITNSGEIQPSYTADGSENASSGAAHGKDTDDWLTKSFWTDTVHFPEDAWLMQNGRLPTLKGMPAGTQNPVAP